MSAGFGWIAALVAGGALGAAFVGGLWWTVNGLADVERPGLRVLGSALLRFGLVLGGAYLLVRHGRWQHVLSGVLGFEVVRWAAVRRVSARPRPPEQPS